MIKYLLRGSGAAGAIVFFSMMLFTGFNHEIFLGRLWSTIECFLLGAFIMEFSTCLISYHHALWTNQDNESPDGTK